LLPGGVQELPHRWRGRMRCQLGAQARDRRCGAGGVDAAEAAHGVGGPVERGAEVVEPQVRLCRAGQVDGVAARVLVIAPVVGGDRGIEAAESRSARVWWSS
jgi:hypothetical protein